MNSYDFTLSGARLTALPSGALWWAAERILAVSDLHLCKSERIARREGRLTPPYETEETLARLAEDVARTGPAAVICLGDSFDDAAAAAALTPRARDEIAKLMAGRRWIWIAGNHDPTPTDLGGGFAAERRVGPLVFRHIAAPGAVGEISGHYHPKLRLRRRRPCFLVDANRAILPAYGTYTGGLDVGAPEFAALLSPDALALATGPKVTPAPWRALCARTAR